MKDEELVVTGRSSYYVRDGTFCVAIAIALLVLQILIFVLGWTDSPIFLPFGVFAAAAFLIGFAIIAFGFTAPCCRACRVGLQPGRHVRIAERGIAAVGGALARADGQVIVDAIAANARQAKEKWVSLQIKYCPSCMAVGVVSLERQDAFVREWPPPRVLSGGDLRGLLEISEVDLE